MKHRQESLVVADIRRLLRLVNDMHALPSGGDGRRRVMLQGLCDLLGADLGESAIVEPDGDGGGAQPRVLSAVRVDAAGRTGRGVIVQRSNGRTATDPAIGPLLRSMRGMDAMLATRTRGELVSDKARHGEVREAVYSARALTPGAERVAIVCLARRRTASRAMGGRECRIAHLLHSEAGCVYDGSATTTKLTERQRECLSGLLTGRSEKQIASDMHLSPHTVHVHVKALYRAFGVSTRGELMSHFMRR